MPEKLAEINSQRRRNPEDSRPALSRRTVESAVSLKIERKKTAILESIPREEASDRGSRKNHKTPDRDICKIFHVSEYAS